MYINVIILEINIDKRLEMDFKSFAPTIVYIQFKQNF